MNTTRSRIALCMAVGWAFLVLALALHQVRFWSASRLNSDVMALLPDARHDALLSKANEAMANAAVRDVIVLLGEADVDTAKAAAIQFRQRIADVEGAPLRPLSMSESDAQQALDFYAGRRDRMLTPEQRRLLLAGQEGDLLQIGLQGLYGIGASSGMSGWIADPLGLSLPWWQARVGRNLSQEDGFLIAEDGERSWVVMRYESTSSAFRLDGVARLRAAIDEAAEHARKAGPEVRILSAGVPLHAEAAAVQANSEINTIGLGSLAAVLVLIALAFMSLRPMLLIPMSLLIGVAAGISVTAMMFGQVHLLTLVFGASLVGVAEDYGIHYFSSRQGNPQIKPLPLMRHLLPGMWLALITSVLAYSSLAMAPLPGLRQMAVFSAVGLSAAFLTVVCWFPYLDRRSPQHSALSRRISASLQNWPRWNAGRRSHQLFAVIATALIVLGLSRVHGEDSLRQLQGSPPGMLAEQGEIARILGLPSPAQFFLLSGDSEEDLLRNEERLKAKLDVLVDEDHIHSYSAVSDWVPSQRSQELDRELVVRTEEKVLAGISKMLGEPLQRPATHSTSIEVAEWARLGIARTMRHQWLGEVDGRWGSVVLINGLHSGEALKQLADASQDLPGVRMIDRSAEMSDLLTRYRDRMAWLLLAGYGLVAAALLYRYRSQAWRALLPTMIAALASLAITAWLGEPVQLFTVLAHFLILGAGVDYGIFLLEHHDDSSSWLAVCLGAASTMLAFGLLALSATPALHTFGLSMLFGVGLSWLLSPCFRLPAAPVAAHAP